MDNDSAEVTSSGRSFHVRGPTTGKARLVGDGCQLDRRHCQTVGASRTERSAARQVGDIVEWCESVQDFENQNSLRHSQAVSCCFQPHHPCQLLTTRPGPARNIKGIYTQKVQQRRCTTFRRRHLWRRDIPLTALCSLRSPAGVDAQSTFVPNRVLGTTPRPEISSLECNVPRSVCNIHLHHCDQVTASCWTRTRPTSLPAWQMSVCPECGVARRTSVPLPCTPDTTHS